MIIWILVKDKTNLFNYNIWSCGDKNHNLSDFYISSTGNTSLSDEHPVNGDYCIKAIRITPGDTSNIYLTCDIDVTEYQGKTVLLEADVLNTSASSISLQLNDKLGGIGYVSIPANSSMETYSCTVQLNENATSLTSLISINSNVTSEEPIFTDNWRLSIQ